MSQQRITLFFPPLPSRQSKSRPQKKSHFLSLPPHIRQKIYQYSGLPSPNKEIIDLSLWRSRNLNLSSNDPLSIIPSIPLSLFPLCRIIHNELVHLLYHTHCIAISSRRHPRDLRILESFSTSTLAKIKFLVVTLNLASCRTSCCGLYHNRRCGNGHYPCDNSSSHDEPLECSLNKDQCVVEQWGRVCCLLGKSIERGGLGLYVICDCRDLETARRVSQAMTKNLGQGILRDCGLRLARDYDVEISKLARETALYLTASPSVSQTDILPEKKEGGFKFLSLPQELQLLILSYTRLVAGWEITCSPVATATNTIISSSTSTQTREKAPKMQMRVPGTCRTSGYAALPSSLTSPTSLNSTNYHITSGNNHLLKCFCPTAHSAYNTLCSLPTQSCTSTLRFPLSYFLVCRTFNTLSTQIFYSKNEFTVKMTLDLTPPTSLHWSQAGYEEERARITVKSEIMPGLAYFPPYTIKHLTHLNLDFEPCPLPTLSMKQPSSPSWKSWLSTVALISAHPNPQVLTLQLRFNEEYYVSIWDFAPESDPAHEVLIRETYTVFLQPLTAALKGRRLRDIFVHLNWASSCGFNTEDHRLVSGTGTGARGKGTLDGRGIVEHALEGMIMGDKGYDAWQRGKVVRLDLSYD